MAWPPLVTTMLPLLMIEAGETTCSNRKLLLTYAPACCSRKSTALVESVDATSPPALSCAASPKTMPFWLSREMVQGAVMVQKIWLYIGRASGRGEGGESVLPSWGADA